MDFDNKVPDWGNKGAEPSDSRKKEGFLPAYKLPAGIVNWFFYIVSKAINELQTKFKSITPASIGAAKSAHTHKASDVNDLREKIDKIVTATSENGVSYTATVEGITELYNGLQITIIPNKRSTSKTITLNVNGLGAVNVRQPLSFSTFVATAPDRDYFLYENTPCRLMYHANYANGGIWLMADKQKTSAQDLYGTVPLEGGGTGGTNVETVKENLGFLSVQTKDIENSSILTDNGRCDVCFSEHPSGKTAEDIIGFSCYAFGSAFEQVDLQGFKTKLKNAHAICQMNVFGLEVTSGILYSGNALVYDDRISLWVGKFDIGTGNFSQFFSSAESYIESMTVYYK